MKKLKILVLTLIIIITLIPTNVSAAEPTGFQTSEIGEDKFDSYLNKLSVSLLTEAPENLAINCFDVNENGLIAIGSKIHDDCYIHVYDSNFNFLYGFAFECMGTYNIEWNDDYINIYYVRGDIAATYDSNGQITDIAKIDNTIDNNSYWYTLKNNERQLGSTKFKAKNDMGILNIFIGQSGYSQLVKTDDLGNEIVLYNVNSFQLAKIVMILFGISFFIAIVILAITKEFTKAKRPK